MLIVGVLTVLGLLWPMRWLWTFPLAVLATMALAGALP